MDLILTNKELSALHLPDLITNGIMVNETRARKISFSLAELERKGLIEKEWRGKRYEYRLSPAGVLALVEIRFELYNSLEGEPKYSRFYGRQSDEGKITFLEGDLFEKKIIEKLEEFDIVFEKDLAEEYLNSNKRKQGAFCIITREDEKWADYEVTGEDFCILNIC